MDSITIILLLVSFFVWLVTLVQPSKKHRQFGDLIPGPKPFPIVGNVPDVGVNSKLVTQTMGKIADKYGSIFRTYLGKDLFVVVSNPVDIETILAENKQLVKTRKSMEGGRPWIGEGLLLAPATFLANALANAEVLTVKNTRGAPKVTLITEGFTTYLKFLTGKTFVFDKEKWKINRKRLLPAFHLKMLENFVPVFNKNALILIKELNSLMDQQEVNISELSARTALRNICETAMGVSLDSLSTNDVYPKTIEKLSSLYATKIFVPLLEYKFIYNLHPIGWQEKRLLKYVDSITDKVIKSRKAENKRWDLTLETQDLAEGQRKRMIFLDLLLKIQEEDPSFDDQQIRDEVNTFMFAGHDTVAATSAFCLYLLSKDRDIQDKIYEETENILGGDDRSLEFKDLQEMKYLEQVIKETLRIYSSVPMIGRCPAFDIKLKSGLVIPAGCEIVCWLHRMHNDPELFPDPKVFNPDRFSAENMKNRHPYSFMPFGAGPRDCIGMKYAYNELKVILANLVRNFVFLPGENQDELNLMTEIVLKTEPDIHVKVKQR